MYVRLSVRFLLNGSGFWFLLNGSGHILGHFIFVLSCGYIYCNIPSEVGLLIIGSGHVLGHVILIISFYNFILPFS